MRLVSAATALILAILTATAGAAATPEEIIFAQLQDEGYTVQQVSTTFLGRIRIAAAKGDYQREIVINPRTGEVLRDYQTILMAGGGNTGNHSSQPPQSGLASEVPDTGTTVASPGEPSLPDPEPSDGGNTGVVGGN